MFPLNQWVFVVLTTSTISQQQYGYRYSLPSTSTRISMVENRTPTGSFYNLDIGGKVFIGGDDYDSPANAWLQYVRVYLNYFPTSGDEVVNLAVMETGSNFSTLNIACIFLSCFIGILYIAHFSSIPSVSNNQTVSVDYIQETTQGTLTAYKGNEIKII
mgnify:CR=1 FL=1